MHRRYDKNHVPIELLRTFAAIVETGSFTKAAAALGLTQSAISAQVKRLQLLVGGEIFARSGPGLRLTDLGEMVESYARRILALNDQIFLHAGAAARTLRAGLAKAMVDRFLPAILEQTSQAGRRPPLLMRCDSSEVLAKSLAAGYLDLAVLIAPPGLRHHFQVEWKERLCWVSAPTFLLSPGAPLPLVSAPESLPERIATRACEAAGLAHTTAFLGTDFNARLLATAAGLGFMVMLERTVPSHLKIARERYLPALPEVSAGICLGETADVPTIKPFLEMLESILRPAAEDFAQEAMPHRPPPRRLGP